MGGVDVSAEACNSSDGVVESAGEDSAGAALSDSGSVASIEADAESVSAGTASSSARTELAS